MIEYGEPDSGGDYPGVLQSPRPTLAGRFWEFVPDVALVGPRVTTLDAAQHQFRFRRDYVARFALWHLSPDEMAAMLDLKEWLLGGGSVKVTTSDADSATYTGLTLRPGATPEIEKDDENRQFYKFRCDLRSASPITVDYR